MFSQISKTNSLEINNYTDKKSFDINEFNLDSSDYPADVREALGKSYATGR